MNFFTPIKDLSSPHEQRADFVELFFDLVFVYAITRITAITAHHLDGLHVLQSALVFWLIWWAWSMFTATLNAANTRLAEVRMIVLISTAVAFIMASSTGEAFEEGVMWFALPYVFIRVLGLILYFYIQVSKKEKLSSAIAFSLISILGFAAVISGCFAEPTQRIWWWITAIIIDMLAAFVGGRFEGFRLHPKHFAERHGLILIIALGESLIVAASAVSSQERSADLLIIGGLTVLVTCLLWWSYFAWINEHLEAYFEKESGIEQARTGRDIYPLMHFLLVAGIIGIAVAFEKVMGHPHDLLSLPIAISLAGGLTLFVGFTAAAVWRASKSILIPRLFMLVLAVVGVMLSVGQPAYFALSVIAASLILLIFVEWKKCRHI